MPKDSRIKKVLVVGSGPIVIGQAAEFDYSGTQAVQAMKEEGVEVVLVNSNPATIMTDRDMADATYIEPLTIEFIEKVIAKERPDSLIAGVGGQTGLNLSCELHDAGILEKYNVRVIGTSIAAIKEGEDRESFKLLMERTHQPIIDSAIVTSVREALDFASTIGYPVIVRPAYTLGGTGGGIAENEVELHEITSSGISLSRVGQVLIERSIKGWKEIEFEVMRDKTGNCITVCSMENVDPVGVHTGDSIVVAPAQTLCDREYQMLRKAAIDIIDSIAIEGGCNVQFALDPNGFDYAVIEINPRVSRSSALASKATGYPIAKVGAKIALGYGLDEIQNAVTKKTFACFEPSIDYVVCKIPKWPFDKFKSARRNLGTKMMATGEIMAIGNSFESALLKGIRSLELGQYTLEKDYSKSKSIDELKRRVVVPDDERLFDLAEILRRGYRVDKVCEITGMDKFFVHKIKKIVDMEENLKKMTLADLNYPTLKAYKKIGFSDKGIADLLGGGVTPPQIYARRKLLEILPVYKMVDTCAGEFEALTPYYYSTYDQFTEATRSDKKKIIVIGSGPIRIGQGIEFDYCSVHAIKALKEAGIETIIINNNPETVSTDFDTSDKLYFEPLTEEDVLNVVELEQPDGVILQFGGQTAIKLAKFFREMDIPIYGTKPEQIDRAEDREKFEELLEELSIRRPKGKGVWSVEDGVSVAQDLGYPVLVRPSYVLGGQGMEITYDANQLRKYLASAFLKDSKNPVLIDRYLFGKELEVDAICDGTDVVIPGIMQHLERAGVHSGDSISIYPPVDVSEEIKQEILAITTKLALALEVSGMINLQFIEFQGTLHIIEVNPRSSRTVPYISKVTGVPIIKLATQVMLGEKLKDLGYSTGICPESTTISVKVPVFSTEKLPEVEVSLGPEMRSTGEVLGLDDTLEKALLKGFLGAGMEIPKRNGTALLSVKPFDCAECLPLALRLQKLGYRLYATVGTANYLSEHGVTDILTVKRIIEGVPNVIDLIRSGILDLIINTPNRGNDTISEGFQIRRMASETKTNLFTSLDTAHAVLDVLEQEISIEDATVTPLHELK
ncbi:MAG: carbamoyl-phosphate synthase large subunit [Eubacteriales bacterium]